ncbi:MAG: endoflagellar motor protein, partial [Spirochaetia bacterium]|nr:endoflagellar motor protein [Spirochaetia bacterium]
IENLDKIIKDREEEIAFLKEKLENENNKLLKELEKLTLQTKKLEEILETEIKKGQLKVSNNKGRIIINFYEMITFNSGSSDLKTEGKRILDKIEKVINTPNYSKISIEGNTDDDPVRNSKFKDNWQLSTDRALSVLEYLIYTKKLNPEKFTIVGNAFYNPIHTLDKSKNRRVDIVLIP